MPRGSKAAYTNKQKRHAERVEEGYEDRGTGKDEAERRAWATVNAMTGGGKKSGSGRGKKINEAPARKGGRLGGKAAAAKKPAARKSPAMKIPATKTPAKKTPATKTPATKNMAEKISAAINSARKTVKKTAAKITSALKPAVKKATAGTCRKQNDGTQTRSDEHFGPQDGRETHPA